MEVMVFDYCIMVPDDCLTSLLLPFSALCSPVAAGVVCF